METVEDRESIFREQRAAKNQSLFRSVNERIAPLVKTFSVTNRSTNFVCECAEETCTEPIEMSVDEYEAIRAQGHRFAVARGDEHVWPDVDEVTEKHDRYWVVEKIGYGASLAAKYDPRARQSA